MRTASMNRAGAGNESFSLLQYKKAGTEGCLRKKSIKERLAAYWEENSAMIIAGMLMLNGRYDAYRTYEMLRNER